MSLPQELLLQSKSFLSWNRRFGRRGNSYVYVGETYTNSAADEKHYTPIEVAKQWGVSPDIVRSVFRDEPGVLKIERPGTNAKRYYSTLRIPESVLVRVHTRLTSRPTVLK
jgi:hypothetical protein